VPRLIAKTVAAAAAAGVVLLAVAAAAMPAVRHIASAWWNDPVKLAALPDDPQVHYEDGAVDRARTVAALLPAAVARVEAAQGRPFFRPPTIGVYVSHAAYDAANGTGNAGAVGTVFLGRVILSPDLFAAERHRLPAILTHELSHAQLRSWLSELAYIHLPNWFKEGLAVMVSRGGGAESVSEREARDAIRRGDQIAVRNSGSLLELDGIRFAQPAEKDGAPHRIVLGYRQAGLFVTFLHDSDPGAFARMMDAVLDGRAFADAVIAAYGVDVEALWLRFTAPAAT
jgi:hypothetical protein